MNVDDESIIFSEVIDGYLAQLRDDGMLLLTELPVDGKKPSIMPYYQDVVTDEMMMPWSRGEFINSVREGIKIGSYQIDEDWDTCTDLLESLRRLPKNIPVGTTPAPARG